MRPRLVFGLRPRARDARGQILVLFMLVLTVLLLLFSLVINVGLTRRPSPGPPACPTWV